MLTVRTNGVSTLACNQLTRANNCIKTSLERLSTGYRINSAKDDAANLAISKNMDCQISGNYVAQDNVQQGMNLLDIADGALDVMTQNVQRIRDLCVQSMNGTYSNEERQMMQSEVEQLTKEIYREKNTTSYNQIKLFESGTEETYETAIAGTPETSAITASHGLPSKYQEVEYIETTGTQYIDTGYKVGSSSCKIDLDVAYVSGGYGFIGNGNLGYTGQGVSLGVHNNKWSCISPGIDYGTFGTATTDRVQFTWEVSGNTVTVSGYDDYTKTYAPSYGTSAYWRTLTMKVPLASSIDAKIYSCKIYDNGTLTRDFIPCYSKEDGATGLYDKVTETFFKNNGSGEFITGPIVPDDLTSIDLQVGANSGEDNRLSVKTGFSLGSYTADVTTIDKASETLDKTDSLISTINTKRSELGTYKNRLESVLSSQETTVENLSASNSTIKDTDFASETATLTKNQILQNMTASLVAQANISPQIALKLLE